MKRKFWIVLMMAVSVLAGCGNVEGTMAEERASGEQQSVVDEVTEGVETEEESSEGLEAAFFAAHAIASSWVGKLATHDRAEASSTYLLCYYAGSSLLGWSHWSTWLVVASVVIAAALFPGLSRLASVE